MALCLLSDLKAWKKINSASEDVLLQKLLDATEQRIAQVTRRRFTPISAARTYIETTTRLLGNILPLDDDLLSLTSVINSDGQTFQPNQVFMLPVNEPPYSMLQLKVSAGVWMFNTDGEIKVNGVWGFTGTPAVVISGGGGRGARAGAVVVCDGVATVEMINGGQDYATPPDVSFIGQGSGATATSTVVNGSVTSITVTAPGSGYAPQPDELVQACRELAIWFYNRRDSGSDSDRPLISGDGTVVLPNRMPSSVEALIAPYRRTMR